MNTQKHSVTLKSFVEHFAKSLEIVDRIVPPATNARTGEEYERGIGPYQEKLLVEQVVLNVKEKNPELYENIKLEVKYPNDRKRCDIVLNDNLFIEVKAVRKMRNNGTQEEFLVNKILSPYDADKSFLTDTKKLLDSGFNGKKAVLMYGYDYPDFPIDIILGCFELLAEKYFCKLTKQYEHPFEGLIHPIHKKGKVKGYLLNDLAQREC